MHNEIWTSNFAHNPNFMCIKNGILRVLFSGHSFIDFQGGVTEGPPPGRSNLSQTSGLRGLKECYCMLTSRFTFALLYFVDTSIQYFVIIPCHYFPFLLFLVTLIEHKSGGKDKTNFNVWKQDRGTFWTYSTPISLCARSKVNFMSPQYDLVQHSD